MLTFGILTLANSLEPQFPHRSEYWWTQLDGTLDQACTCFSMQAWIDQLETCENEESFKTTYQSFLDTTWQALLGEQQCTGTGDFPYVQPAEDEIRRAYYMKNRTLLLHNQLYVVKGPLMIALAYPLKSSSQSKSPQRKAHLIQQRNERIGQMIMATAMIHMIQDPVRILRVREMKHTTRVRRRMRRKPQLRMANRSNLQKLKHNELLEKPRKRYRTWKDNGRKLEMLQDRQRRIRLVRQVMNSSKR